MLIYESKPDLMALNWTEFGKMSQETDNICQFVGPQNRHPQLPTYRTYTRPLASLYGQSCNAKIQWMLFSQHNEELGAS